MRKTYTTESDGRVAGPKAPPAPGISLALVAYVEYLSRPPEVSIEDVEDPLFAINQSKQVGRREIFHELEAEMHRQAGH